MNLTCPHCGSGVEVEMRWDGYPHCGEYVVDYIGCESYRCGATWSRYGIQIMRPKSLTPSTD